MQNYFDVPRFTEKQFEEKARDIAKKLDTVNFEWDGTTKPVEGTQLASKEMRFRLPIEGGFVVISLTEEDLPVYESLFSDSVERNRELLTSKTEISEHDDVVKVREERAKKYLIDCVKNKNGERALVALNDLNRTSIESLDPELIFNLLKTISEDNEAIDQVWNKNNLTYRVSERSMPDWVRDSAERLKSVRYKVASALPMKVDSYLVGKAINFAATSDDPKIQAETAYALMKILTSPTYLNAHKEEQGEIFDNHLQNILKFCTNEDIDRRVREMTADLLVKHYGASLHHWKNVVLGGTVLINKAIKMYPEYFSQFQEKIQIRTDVIPIDDILESEIDPVNKSKVENTLLRQREANLPGPPHFNIIVRIGREIQSKIDRNGIERIGGVTEQNVLPDALLEARDWLNMSPESQDFKKVSKHAIKQLKELHALIPEDGIIRIVAGGFPNALMANLVMRIAKLSTKEKYKDLTKRVVMCHYNMSDEKFYDYVLDDGDDEEE